MFLHLIISQISERSVLIDTAVEIAGNFFASMSAHVMIFGHTKWCRDICGSDTSLRTGLVTVIGCGRERLLVSETSYEVTGSMRGNGLNDGSQ